MRAMTLLLGLTLGLAACDPPPVNRDAAVPLTVAGSVDLTRYAGRWFEIARFENSFEENCVGVTADYARNADGSIAVTNTCRKGTLDGPLEVAEGTAYVVEGSGDAKLRVSFFGPFYGDYWVLAVADDYSWALVGEPSGRYLWILSRTPRIDAALQAELLARLKALGYNLEALTFTPQG